MISSILFYFQCISGEDELEYILDMAVLHIWANRKVYLVILIMVFSLGYLHVGGKKCVKL